MFRRTISPLPNQSVFFIKDLFMPACINCIHFKQHTNTNTNTTTTNTTNTNDSKYVLYLSNCLKFGHKDLISGKVVYDFADKCRSDEVKCGLRAKFFVKI
jgi:hypothetical protein